MNAIMEKAMPDEGAMLKALAALYEPDDVVELRAFHKGRKRTDAGYFDGEHRHELAQHAARLNAAGAAVYVTLNPVDRQLLGRYCNRVEQYADSTATDANVTWRRWLLLDFDPKRPKNTSATADQLEAAKAAARACYTHLKARGWPEPLSAESGNGMHLLYALDLPNDDASRDLVKGALIGLAARFDDGVVSLDTAVFNAGRITKLYGTVATKGDHTQTTPWRLSRLLTAPQRGATVTAEQLQNEHLQRGNQEPQAPASASTYNGASFELPQFLGRLGIEYDQDHHDGRDRYKLHHCPFNSDHGKGEAAVFRDPATGRLGFKCQHASCADNDWQALRALIDGPREARNAPHADPSGILSQGHRRGAEPAVTGDSAGAEWPEPLPIPSSLLPVESFADVLLPDALRAWVADIAERMQCPPDFPAVGAMVALSSVIGRKACIAPKRHDDWRVVPNLWGAVVGRPAS